VQETVYEDADLLYEVEDLDEASEGNTESGEESSESEKDDVNDNARTWTMSGVRKRGEKRIFQTVQTCDNMYGECISVECSACRRRKDSNQQHEQPS